MKFTALNCRDMQTKKSNLIERSVRITVPVHFENKATIVKLKLPIV